MPRGGLWQLSRLVSQPNSLPTFIRGVSCPIRFILLDMGYHSKTGIVALAFAAGLQVSGATPVASFEFNGSLVDSMGSGMVMTGISYVNNAGGVAFVPSAYSTGMVFGNPDDTYLSLAGREGLNLDISSLPSRLNYTIVMDVRTSQVNSYNKLISLDGGVSDSGLYFHGGKMVFFPVASTSTELVTADQWTRVGMTYDGTTFTLMQGTPENFRVSGTISSASSFVQPGNILQLLVDDSRTGRNENSPIDVSRILIFDEAISLTDLQPVAVPEPSQVAYAIGGAVLLGLATWRRGMRR